MNTVGIGRGGKGCAGWRSTGVRVESRGKLWNASVVRSELVAPFTYAVCFVDDNHRYPTRAKRSLYTTTGQLFWGKIEQLEAMVRDSSDESSFECRWCGMVPKCRTDTSGGELVDLIFHESNQWRDNDGSARKDKRWELVAQRLAAPRWKQCQTVTTRQYTLDNGELLRPKRALSEPLLENADQIE